MKLTKANCSRNNRNHAISSSAPGFIRRTGRSGHLSCNNCHNSRPLQDPEEYDPIHLGPNIMVSSADGTTICPEPHSDDEMNNVAAFQLFRAIEAQIEDNRQRLLDRHLDIVIGAIDIEVQKRSVGARRSVHVVERPNFEPQQGVFEGVDEDVAQGKKDIFRRVSTKTKRRILGWRDRHV